MYMKLTSYTCFVPRLANTLLDFSPIWKDLKGLKGFLFSIAMTPSRSIRVQYIQLQKLNIIQETILNRYLPGSQSHRSWRREMVQILHPIYLSASLWSARLKTIARYVVSSQLFCWNINIKTILQSYKI